MEHAPKHESAKFHPLVWIALVSFVAWFVAAMWGFAAGGYVDWLLFVVSAFFLIVVTLTLTLSRVGRSREQTQRGETLGEWAQGDFETWQGHSKASEAAIEAITPIAAAAVGMTAFAIVFHVVSMHASL